MKKTVCLIAFLLGTSSVYASGYLPADERNPFEGFNFSVGIGGINTSFDGQQSVSLVDNDDGDFLTASGKFRAYNTSVLGSAGLGYTASLNSRFTLGLAGTADIENSQITQSLFRQEGEGDGEESVTLTSQVIAKLRYTFALLVKPGVLLGPRTLLYGLVGPRWGNFKISSQARLLAVNEEETADIRTPLNTHSHYQCGVTAGGGVEQYLGKGFGMGVEYDYTYYGTIASASSRSALVPSIETSGDTLTHTVSKIKAKTNTILLNIFYNFA